MKALDSAAVSIFVGILVELTNTVFVNSTNISTNIETAALSSTPPHLFYAKVYQLSHRSHLLLHFQVQMVAHRLSDHTFSAQYLLSPLQVLRHCCRCLPEAVQIMENCSL